MRYEDLKNNEKEKLEDIARLFLSKSGLLCCNRDWEAWSVGTMTEVDFTRAEEEDDVVLDMAILLFNTCHATP